MIKSFLALSVIASVLLGMTDENEKLESLSLCETTNGKMLVTVTEHKFDGRAIWIDNWETLTNDSEAIFVPIQTKNGLRSRASIEKWMTPTFGYVKCSPISEEEVQKELDKQTGTIRF